MDGLQEIYSLVIILLWVRFFHHAKNNTGLYVLAGVFVAGLVSWAGTVSLAIAGAIAACVLSIALIPITVTSLHRIGKSGWWVLAIGIPIWDIFLLWKWGDLAKTGNIAIPTAVDRVADAQEALLRELYNKSGVLYQQGQYSEAAKVAEEALTVSEKTFGSNHPYVAVSLNNLALVYQSQGKYAEAESNHKRSLKIREKALGKDHPQVAATCENMAELCKQIGKGDEAGRLEARARRIRSNQ